MKVVIASLIAGTSMVAAIGAWRASEASGSSADLDRKGFADTVARARSEAEARATVTRSLRTYLRARLYEAQGAELRRQAVKRPADAERLAAQAEADEGLARYADSRILSDARGPDGKLDLGRQFTIEMTLARRQNDIDPNPEFARSDDLSAKSERLVGITALLVAAAFFFTIAQISRRRTYVIYLLAGVAVMVASTGLLIGVEVAT